jgi:hypothetical protein
VKNICLLAIVFLVVITAIAYAEHPCGLSWNAFGRSANTTIFKVNQSLHDGEVGAARCLLEGYIASYRDWSTIEIKKDPAFSQYVDSALDLSRPASVLSFYQDSSLWVCRGDDSTFGVFVKIPGPLSLMCILADQHDPAIVTNDVNWDTAYLGYQGRWSEDIPGKRRQELVDFVQDSLTKRYCASGDSSAYYKLLAERVDLNAGPRSCPNYLGYPAEHYSHLGTFITPTGIAAKQFHRLGLSKLFISNDWHGWRFFYFEGSRTIHALPSEKAFEKPTSAP